MLRLLKFFLPHKGMIAVMMICIVLSTLVSLVSPYLSGTVLYGDILECKLETINFAGINVKVTTALLIIALTIFVTKLINRLLSTIQSISVAKIVP